MLAEAAALYGRLAPADPAAAEGLRDVRAELGDLAGAVEVQRRLGGGGPDPILAHLLAAWSREAGASRPDARGGARAARRSRPIRRARTRCSRSPRREGARGDEAAALAAVGRALDADPRAAVLAWPALERAAGAAAGEAFVTRPDRRAARGRRAPPPPRARAAPGRPDGRRARGGSAPRSTSTGPAR